MRRVLINLVCVVSLVTLIVISLDGCGSKESSQNMKVVTIRFLCEPNPIRKQQVELFEKTHPQIKIEMDVVGAGRVEKTLTSIAGGSAPDVFFVGGDEVQEFAKKDVLQPLDTLIEKDPEFGADELFPAVVEFFRYQGKLVGLAANCTPWVIFYNKTLFDEARTSYPDEDWTWEDFRHACLKLTRRGEDGRISQYGAILTIDDYRIVWMFIKQNGGRFYNEDGTRCVINSQEAQEAVQFLHDLAYKDKVITTLADVSGPEGRTGMDQQLFCMGKAGMIITGRWYSITFRQCKDLDFRLAPAYFNQKEKVTFLGGMAWAMSRQSKQKDAAWEFIKFLIGEESQSLVIESGDGVPTLIRMADSERFLHDERFPNEDNQVYATSMRYAVSIPESPYVTLLKVRSIFYEELGNLYYRGHGVKDTLGNIEKKINKEISENIQREKREEQ